MSGVGGPSVGWGSGPGPEGGYCMVRSNAPWVMVTGDPPCGQND